MDPYRLSHRGAVAFGVPAAAAPAAMFLVGLVSGSPVVGIPVVQRVLGVAALVLLVVLRAAAVVLAVRAGWSRTAGLVLLAGGGLVALRDVHVLALVDTLWAGPFAMLIPIAVAAGILAGVAALLALRAQGPGPLAGPRGSAGWRLLIAVAAMSLAAIELGQAGVSAVRGAPPVFLGEVAGVLVGVVVAVAALRVADGRVVALLVAIPGAGALGEAARTVQWLSELPAPGLQAAPTPLLVVQLLAAIALAGAAAGLWEANRPLRDRPLVTATNTGASPWQGN